MEVNQALLSLVLSNKLTVGKVQGLIFSNQDRHLNVFKHSLKIQDLAPVQQSQTKGFWNRNNNQMNKTQK